MDKDKIKNSKCSISKCVIVSTFEILGGKWKIPIIWHLSAHETIRYNELKRQLDGITNIMLTRSLQDLMKHGFVNRKEYSVIPPHVEYSLTDEAIKLLPALKLINEWGKERFV